MKTMLLFIALATALWGEDIKPSPPSMPPEKHDLVFRLFAKDIGSLSWATNTDMTFQRNGVSFLKISGLPADPKQEGDLGLPRYHAPESPNDVAVTLWTKDGKKYVAKWEEAK